MNRDYLLEELQDKLKKANSAKEMEKIREQISYHKITMEANDIFNIKDDKNILNMIDEPLMAHRPIVKIFIEESISYPVPNDFIHSGLFSTKHLGEFKTREFLKEIKIPSSSNREIFYSGIQLDMFDKSMLEFIYKKVANKTPEQPENPHCIITTSFYEICNYFDISVGGDNYTKIYNSISSLTGCRLSIKNRINCVLISRSEFKKNELGETTEILIDVNLSVCDLYKTDYTKITIKKDQKKLEKNYLETKLKELFESVSHLGSYSINIETLKDERCRLRDMLMGEFRKKLKTVLTKLNIKYTISKAKTCKYENFNFTKF